MDDHACDLWAVSRGLLAPYDDLGAFSGRIRVSVSRMSVDGSATTIFALIVHELATNSFKYGALSVETSTLDVSCSATDDAVTLIWTERWTTRQGSDRPRRIWKQADRAQRDRVSAWLLDRHLEGRSNPSRGVRAITLALVGRVHQVIVRSHSKQFLCQTRWRLCSFAFRCERHLSNLVQTPLVTVLRRIAIALHRLSRQRHTFSLDLSQ
jgi:hypothetical protein